MTFTRRDLLKAGSAAAAAAAAPAGGIAQTKEVIVAATGGLMERSLQEHFYKRFEAQTGIRVRSVPIELPDQWARAIAGARAGNVPFDIVTATPPDLIQHREILADVNCASPSIKENALPGGCFPKGLMRTGGGMTICWSTKAFPAGKGPQSWADFYDTARFPGPRSLPDTGDREWWVPLSALLADGVPADKLFPLDLDRAYARLDKLKPSVAAWWKSGDNSQAILRGGDAVMSMLYSSRSVALSKGDEPFDFTWNQAIRDVGNWAVLRNGPNGANAQAFLDFFVQGPAEHVEFGRKVAFDSNNAKAGSAVPPAERRFRSSMPENWSKLVVADYEWIAANREKMRERWVSWLSK